MRYDQQNEEQQRQDVKTNTHEEGIRMAYCMWLIPTTVQKEFAPANRLDIK